MPKAASLRNLRPWKPGQSGNPNGRPRAPRFTERDQHAILTALRGARRRSSAGLEQRNAGRVDQPPNGPKGPRALREVERGARLAAPDVACQRARSPEGRHVRSHLIALVS